MVAKSRPDLGVGKEQELPYGLPQQKWEEWEDHTRQVAPYHH